MCPGSTQARGGTYRAPPSLHEQTAASTRRPAQLRDRPFSFVDCCHALVLQLRFSLTAVVGGCRLSLVSSPPERPGHDEAGSDRWPEQNTRQKIADLGHARQQRGQAPQAAAGTAGLLSFALPQVARRRLAANRARKAAAARHRLMCRCHPCQERASQWSRPRSSLARSKHSSIVQRSPAAPASSPSETPTGANTK